MRMSFGLPLHIIVPPLDNGSPSGDQTTSATDRNELVFDKTTPGGLRFSLEVAEMPGLSDKAKAIVLPLCRWEVPRVGRASPTIGAAEGRVSEVSFAQMPLRHDDFGRKRITLRLHGRSEWQWYNDVEFFFGARGIGATRSTETPNWLYYWRQIKDARAGNGNRAGIKLIANTSEYFWLWGGPRGQSTISIAMPRSLSGYIGILAHEQQHESDFYEVVWNKSPYNNQEDGDRDGIRDVWEQNENGDGWNHPSKNLSHYFETYKDEETESVIFAWGDLRGDIAAKSAVEADLAVDRLDWSDLSVSAGIIWRFFDENDEKKEHLQECLPTNSSNNKDYP